MKKIILILTAAFLMLSTTTQAQPELWGMTSNGGEFGNGIIFKTDINGENQTVEHSLLKIEGRCPMYVELCEADNGKLYGMTFMGGINGLGVIFEYDPETETYTKKFDDFNITNGYDPYGSLMQASNGKLYGMTLEGGTNGHGVIFEYDPVSNIYTKKLDFDGTNTGRDPVGSLMQASNEKLYGMTSGGGTNDLGVIFEYDLTTDTYTKKINFEGANNGSKPCGNLMQASNGKLYGMTWKGGTNDLGVIFEYDPAIDTCIKKLDFDGTDNGSYPNGSLMQASDGKLYGMTKDGGTNNYGVIFEYDLTIDTCIKKFDFDGNDAGGEPYGSLMQSSNGKLYGMVPEGGTNSCGVIFEYDPVSNIYTKKLDFNYTNGSHPRGSLMQASNGKLYGMASGGGTEGYGTLFEYEPDTDIYTKKLDFKGTNGSSPYGSLMQASDKKFYGMTYYGGSNDLGVIFEYDPETGIYIRKLDFDDTNNGSKPCGNLMQASNGKLYGMTKEGGTNGCGVIFEYDPATGIYTKKIDFDDTNNGAYPLGNLIQASNGKLYGMTPEGGTNGCGVIFEYDLGTDIYTKKYDFDHIGNGSYPYGSLMQASDGKLYGMAAFEGGTNDFGVIFEYDLTTGIYTKKHDFDDTGTNGKNPYGSLIQAGNGKLYGMTFIGGTNGDGVIFEYDPVTNIYTKKIDFDGTNNGRLPYGSLMQASNGNLYGMTYDGGTSSKGVLFEYAPETNAYTKKLDFNSTNGSWPYYTSLIEICPAKFTNQNFTVCAGDSILINGEYLYSAGTYYDTLTTCFGCDSIVITDLTVYTVNTSVTINQSTLTADAVGTYQWIDCSDNTAITGETNQSFTPSVTGNYAVEVTENSCTDTSLCYNVIITSIPENNLTGKITIYPNPASDFITVKLPGQSESYKITLINMLGKVLFEDDLTEINNRINLVAYEKGIYFLTISDTQNKIMKSFKIIKKQ